MAEPDGFDAFVVARSPALLRFGWLLTGNRATAEDLVQAALMRTWARWGRLDSVDAAEPYVRRVMVTQYATWWRRRWRAEVLRFRLRDGTTVVRQWDPDRRLIIGAIELSASVVALLQPAR